MMPSRFLLTIASSDESTIAALKCAPRTLFPALGIVAKTNDDAFDDVINFHRRGAEHDRKKAAVFANKCIFAITKLRFRSAALSNQDNRLQEKDCHPGACSA